MDDMGRDLAQSVEERPIFHPPAYYANARPEMLRFVPETALRILDVGCGAGRFGELLKRTRSAAEVWGVDMCPEEIEAAGLLSGFPDHRTPWGARDSATAIPAGENRR